MRPHDRLPIRTNLHTPEEVLAARKAAHEQQSVKALINLLRLLFDQLYGLDGQMASWCSWILSGRVQGQTCESGTDLIDNWFKHLPAQEVSRDSQFSVEKPHGRIIRVLYIETGKVEHLVC
jgi:hypothetical protein